MPAQIRVNNLINFSFNRGDGKVFLVAMADGQNKPRSQIKKR